MAILSQVHLASTDVSAYTKGWKLDKARNEVINVDALTIELFYGVRDEIAPAISQVIEVWGGYTTATDEKKFKGIIVNVEREGYGYKITAYGMLYQLVQRNVNKFYDYMSDASAGDLQKIIIDLIDTYGKLDADATTIYNPHLLIKEFICRHADVADRVKALSAIPNCTTHYNYADDKVYWLPMEYTSNANNLVIGGTTGNVIARQKWKEEVRGWLCNSLYLSGGADFVKTTKTFSGNGTTKDFVLDYNPEDAQVSVGGVEKLGGRDGIITSYDYSVKKDSKTISFLVAPGVGVDNVEVIYSYAVQAPIHAEDWDSQEEYDLFETTITLSDIMEIDDAEKQAQAYIHAHKTPVMSTMMTISPTLQNSNAYLPNQTVYIQDTLHTEASGTYAIYRIVETYPESGIVLYVSDMPLRGGEIQENLATKIKRIEEKTSQASDLVSELISINHDITYERHNFNVVSQFITDSFILGCEVQGALGRGKILEDFEVDSTVNWAGDGFVLAEEAVEVQVGAKSLKLTYAAAGTHTITTTQSFGDLSGYTGSASGAPAKGTVGLWIYKAAGDTIDSIKIRIGSSDGNYTEVTGATRVDDGWQTGWNYVVFNLTSGAETGTPDWSAVDYVRVAIELSSLAGDLYADYLTISESNEIGLNGLGERVVNVTREDTTY